MLSVFRVENEGYQNDLPSLKQLCHLGKHPISTLSSVWYIAFSNRYMGYMDLCKLLLYSSLQYYLEQIVSLRNELINKTKHFIKENAEIMMH